MKKLLLVPAILLAACTENSALPEEPVSTESGQSTGGVGGGADNEGFDTPTLFANIATDPGDCFDSSALVYGTYYYSDGSSTENVVCQLIFADGTTSDSCFASRPFPEPELVTLVVRDTVTLAEGRTSQTVVGPESFTATLAVTTDGLTISWEAHTFYG